MTNREALHALVDDLPDAMLTVAARDLGRLRGAASDQFWRRLIEAPIDDEPLSAADIDAIEAGWRSYREGRGISDAAIDALMEV